MDSPGSRSSRSRSRASSRESRKSGSPMPSPRSGSSRSRSTSRSVSAGSRSRSMSSARGSSRSRSRSGSRSSSPRYVSATPSASDSNVEKKKNGSTSSVSAASSSSSKGKRRLKVKDRKVSSQMASKMDENSDDDDEKKVHIVKKKEPNKSKEKINTKGSKKESMNKRGKKKRVHEASEEGEVSSEEKEFDDGLDEDLMGNEEDRDYLEGLTEKEREEELFKRAENREQLKKRFEIQKKLRIQQKLKGSLTPKKRKSVSDDEVTPATGHEAEKENKDEIAQASDSYEDDYSNVADTKIRAQDRQIKINSKKYDKKSCALSELRAKRQERERKDQQRKQKKELESKDSDFNESSSGEDADNIKGKRQRSRSKSSSRSRSSGRRRSSRSSSSSSDSSKRSGSESPDGRESVSPKPQEYVENLEDLKPILLARDMLERFVHFPFFKTLAVGCFVRIGIGKNPESRAAVYRCVEIRDVVETAKVYLIGRVRTNTGLKIRFGQQETVFRLQFCSNGPVEPNEFLNWKNTCQDANVALPTIKFVSEKKAEIKEALKYEYSSEDVDKIMLQKERYNKKPVNYAMYKARLHKEKHLAITEGNEIKSGELESKLNEIEERAEELDKRRTHTISSVALINDRNRKANVSKAEEAIRMEMKKEKNEGVIANPFKRRKCNPRMVTKLEIKDENVDNPGVVSEEKENHEMKVKVDQIITPGASKELDNTPSIKQPIKSELDGDVHTNGAAAEKEDLFDAHNFDIEINVDTNVVAANPVNVNLKPVNLATKDLGLSKRSLNLDDYKKKRGLI